MGKIAVEKLKRMNTGFTLTQIDRMKIAQHDLMVANANEFVRVSMNLVLELYDNGKLEYQDGKLKIVVE